MLKTGLTVLTICCYCLLSTAQQVDWERVIDPNDVTIARDKWGVPHIYGKTDADAVYGMAWAGCEDNFELMQHGWAASRGRAGEILGKEGAIFDVIAFVAGAKEASEKGYETAFSEEFKTILTAYVQAVNDYAYKNPKEVLLKKLFPITEQDVVCGYVLGNMIMSGAAFDVGKIFGNTIKSYEEAMPAMPTGSNGFAISKNKTKEKKTFFVSNSHQPVEGILAWYEVHINSDEGWNMLGATFPSGITPFVGTNEHLGWTHTVNHPDMSDVYRLQMHPSKKLTYKYDEGWEKLEKMSFTFKVKLGAIKLPITKKFYKSKHGVVLKNKEGFYAMRFSANRAIAAAEQWYRMNKATNLEEFKTALEMQQISCFNVIYADKEDNIYMLGNGLIPNNRKEGYDWQKVLPGNSSELVWSDEFYKMEELPQLENPESGYIFNANNGPFNATAADENLRPEDYPNDLMGYLEKETNRSLRITELMKDYDKLSYEDLKTIKYDLKYESNTFYTYNIENLDLVTKLDAEKYPDLADVFELLEDWDRETDLEEDKIGVFSVAFSYIIDELSARSTILEANTLPEVVFVEAFRKAKRFMLKHHGTLKIPFGEMHIHRRAEGSDVQFPMQGLPENIAAMAYTRDKKDKGMMRTYSGESFILLAQYNEEGVEKVETIAPFGSSSHPESPHYTDQMEMYVNQQLKPMTMDKAEIMKAAEKIYSPAPGIGVTGQVRNEK